MNLCAKVMYFSEIHKKYLHNSQKSTTFARNLGDYVDKRNTRRDY